MRAALVMAAAAAAIYFASSAAVRRFRRAQATFDRIIGDDTLPVDLGHADDLDSRVDPDSPDDFLCNRIEGGCERAASHSGECTPVSRRINDPALAAAVAGPLGSGDVPLVDGDLCFRCHKNPIRPQVSLWCDVCRPIVWAVGAEPVEPQVQS